MSTGARRIARVQPEKAYHTQGRKYIHVNQYNIQYVHVGGRDT